MDSNGNKKKISRTTAVLLAVFALSLLIFITVSVIIPTYEMNRFFRGYQVYGGMTEELKDSVLYEDMQSGRSFCFLGDSITNGNMTNGIAWYLPLKPYIKGKTSDVCCGGWTIKDLVEQEENIPEADVYVVAIGINDVLFPASVQASATESEFTYRAAKLADVLKHISPDSKIYFIAPWTFVGVDDWYVERGNRYRAALGEWCSGTDCIFINPDPAIMSVFETEDSHKYMFNEFHPNSPEGVGLFSYAVLKAAHDQGV